VSVHPPAAAACGGLLLWAKWVRDIDRQWHVAGIQQHGIQQQM